AAMRRICLAGARLAVLDVAVAELPPTETVASALGVVLELKTLTRYLPPVISSSLQRSDASSSICTLCPTASVAVLTATVALTGGLDRPFTVTVTGTVPLETHGTVAMSCVAEALVTTAFADPTRMVLPAGVVANDVPVIVIALPGTSGFGDIDAMV